LDDVHVSAICMSNLHMTRWGSNIIAIACDNSCPAESELLHRQLVDEAHKFTLTIACQIYSLCSSVLYDFTGRTL